MLANNTLNYLFNFNYRLYSEFYSTDSFPYSTSSTNTPVILPSLCQLPIPNLNNNKLAPIKAQAQIVRVKTSQQQQFRYKCKKCTKSYNRKNSLVRHERVHTGKRPYSCKACNKKFTRKDILEGHKLSLKCQRRTQFYLNSSTTASKSNKDGEMIGFCSRSSSKDSPDIENIRRNSISSLLSNNNTDYYLQNFDIEQLSPLRLPSLSEAYKF